MLAGSLLFSLFHSATSKECQSKANESKEYIYFCFYLQISCRSFCPVTWSERASVHLSWHWLCLCKVWSEDKAHYQHHHQQQRQKPLLPLLQPAVCVCNVSQMKACTWLSYSDYLCSCTQLSTGWLSLNGTPTGIVSKCALSSTWNSFSLQSSLACKWQSTTTITTSTTTSTTTTNGGH